MSCQISLEEKMNRSIKSISTILSNRSRRRKTSFSGGHWGHYIPILSVLLAILVNINPKTHFDCFEDKINYLVMNEEAYWLVYILISNKSILLQLLQLLQTKKNISMEGLNDKIDKLHDSLQRSDKVSIDVMELANVAISYQAKKSSSRSTSSTRKSSSRSASYTRKYNWENESHGVWKKGSNRR